MSTQQSNETFLSVFSTPEEELKEISQDEFRSELADLLLANPCNAGLDKEALIAMMEAKCETHAVILQGVATASDTTIQLCDSGEHDTPKEDKQSSVTIKAFND